jgi:uncharacterized protein YoxC
MEPLHVDVHVHSSTHEIESKLDLILRKIGVLMATLDQILADVTAESTAIDSVVALIDGLKKQLADALAGVTLPAAVQAKVDAIFTGTEANAAKVAAALAANVPPAV